MRHSATQKLARVEKQLSKSHYRQFAKINSEKEAEKYEEAVNHINICKGGGQNRYLIPSRQHFAIPQGGGTVFQITRDKAENGEYQQQRHDEGVKL